MSFTVNHLKTLLSVIELVFSGGAQTRVSSSAGGVSPTIQPSTGLSLGSRGWGQESVSQVLPSSLKQEFPGRTCEDVGIRKGETQ